jgi:hypothetical protein
MVETVTREGSGNRQHVEQTSYKMAADGTPITDARAYLEANPQEGLLAHPRNPKYHQAIQELQPAKQTLVDQRDFGDHFSDFWSASGRTMVAVGGAALVIGGSVATLTGVGAPVGIPLIALGVAGASAETYALATNRQGASVINVLSSASLAAGGVGFQLAGSAVSATSAAANVASRVPSSLGALAPRVAQSSLAPLAANSLRVGMHATNGVAIAAQSADIGSSVLSGKELSAVQVLNYFATISGTAMGFKWATPSGFTIPKPSLPRPTVTIPKLSVSKPSFSVPSANVHMPAVPKLKLKLDLSKITVPTMPNPFAGQLAPAPVYIRAGG